MAQTEVHLKELWYPVCTQPAELTAVRSNREGILILSAAKYIIRARFTPEETSLIGLKFNRSD